MAKKAKKNFYAYVVANGAGIVSTWAECEALTKGKPARFQGFATRGEAEAWLAGGAVYESKSVAKQEARDQLPEDGVYFDAGTGRGKGTEVRVTDRDGVPLTWMALEGEEVTPEGNLRLRGRSNNFGELTGLALALEIALKTNKREVLGDSKLVIDYWSKGYVSRAKAADRDLASLVEKVRQLRARFEARGGRVIRIGGGVNPADLGFHRD